MALIALLIKMSDGGPILYFQERMGLNGRRFRMIKFRTMRANAEGETVRLGNAGDQRRTRLDRSFVRPVSTNCRSFGTCSSAI